ncbi:apolipoprotein N-acyltransferase [Rhizomicrobium electricum]|uniref:Apolipoprotein N-acyltransferase n=1 Tax=Rhizomicrobium electricum TaxID=480070 RepID=A0ABP3QIF7_9PROT|nr:apolipoprotein N-acyltransferase [Rhizomicrobium electricum]NIJ49164.1 apolipoprotein N-acyltransferase [Rhizomicrobium electricum]
MLERLTPALAAAGDFVRGLNGWRRLGFAFAAGLVSALGFAPFNVFPALLLGFAAVVLMIDGAEPARRIRTGAAVTWAFGFGQYALGMHWIAYAFMVDPVAHAWQIPFVFVFFAALALFQLCAGALAARFWRGRGRLFAFALSYGVFEWLRGHIFTGFPWNIPAYGWGASLGVLQSAAVFGAYGLSLLTVLFGAALADLFAPPPRWKIAAALAGVFAVFFVGGAVRLETAAQTVPGVNLRLVQPNVPQAEKYLRRYKARNWRRLIELSRAPGDPTLIVWPEAAPPFAGLDEQPLALEQIAALTVGRQGLITGAVRVDYLSADKYRYFNSLFVFGRDGKAIATYDKYHLVPFGEYLPYEETLNSLGLTKLTGIDGSFTPGDGPKAYAVPGAGTLTPLICYEILFPGEVVGATRPDWFVNITDDSWFGPWAGPQQHLLVARVRAIEEGLPVARAANTGISAIIDPFGRITHRLGLNQTGTVDGPLPAAIAPTPYSRFGDLWFVLLVCANVALTWLFSKGK